MSFSDAAQGSLSVKNYWTNVKAGTDTHGAQRMKPNVFGDSRTTDLGPPGKFEHSQ